MIGPDRNTLCCCSTVEVAKGRLTVLGFRGLGLRDVIATAVGDSQESLGAPP